jgi:uncharacterized tellurite resistance protein B-like protein
MKQNFKFIYPKSMRSLIDEKRHYEIQSTKLPSVTTILSATMPEDKRKLLIRGKKELVMLKQIKLKMMQRIVERRCIL